MAEKVVWIDYNASLEPPFNWEVRAIGEDGTELIMDQGEGAWMTAAYRAQDLRKMLGIRPRETARELKVSSDLIRHCERSEAISS